MNTYEHIWTHMNTYEHIWTHMNTYEHIWIRNKVYMNKYEICDSAVFWRKDARMQPSRLYIVVGTYKWAMSRMNESSHTWMSHITCKLRHGTYECVMSHMDESYHIWKNHVTLRERAALTLCKRAVHNHLGCTSLYRVAKTHRMPWCAGHFPQKRHWI